MRLIRLAKRILAIAVVALVARFVGRRVSQRRATTRVNELREHANLGQSAGFTADDLEGLPDPVQAYFETVLEEGHPYVDVVRLEQEGELRLGDASSAWRSYTATQHVTIDPPGFFWNASVDLAPLVRLGIYDRYQESVGSATVSLFGVVPIGGADPSPELNEAELIRYLAEAAWYPTALLPREGVQWTAIDDRTAAATLEYDDATATLTYHFDEDDLVTKVHAEQRARRVGDGYEPTPWTGHWHDYETRNGILVPSAGTVTWHLPDGDMQAWRGRLTDISYDEW